MSDDKFSLEEILKMLDEAIASGLWFEINAESSATLKEYIDAQNKQLAIVSTVNQMKQNNINALRENLEIAERKINKLQDKLNQTKLQQLKDKEMELDLQLTNKRYQIEQYVKTIETIESEIKELNSKLDIIPQGD